MLLATLLMTVILGALATVTAQWLPNWNRGMARRGCRAPSGWRSDWKGRWRTCRWPRCLFQAGVFGRHNFGPAYISAALAYGWHDVTTNRTVPPGGFDQLQGCFQPKGGFGQNVVKFQPMSRLNAILVVSHKPDYLKRAGTWIARLDQSDTDGVNPQGLSAASRKLQADRGAAQRHADRTRRHQRRHAQKRLQAAGGGALGRRQGVDGGAAVSGNDGRLPPLARPRRLGLGDIKLAGVAGSWLGLATVFAAVELATLTALGGLLPDRCDPKAGAQGDRLPAFGLFLAPAI